MRRVPTSFAAWSLLLFAGAAWAAGEAPMAPLPPLGLGLTMRLDAGSDLPSDWGPALPADAPLLLRIVVPRAAAGDEGLARLDRRIDEAAAAGWRVLLCLTDAKPAVGDAVEPEALQGWLEFVRQVARRYRGRVDLYQVWEDPDQTSGWDGEPSARDYAFLFKSTAVTVRAEVPTATVALGSLGPDAVDFLRDLFDHGVAPYADAVALRGRPSGAGDDELTSIRRVVLEGDAASPIWFTGAGDGEIAAEFAAGAGRGARLVLFRAGGEELRQVRLLHRWFGPSVGPMPGEAPEFHDAGGTPVPVQAFSFLDADAFWVLLLYRPAAGGGPGGEVVLRTADVRAPRLVDLVTGEERDAGIFIPDRRSDTTRVDVPLDPGPHLLVYDRGADDALRAGRESLAVTGAEELSVEEILARHQAFRSAQDDKLETYTAGARVNLHFQIGAGRSLDVTYLNRFFYRRGQGPEWEQLEMLINGVRWKGKRIPRLPFVEPDKVVILPLDIHLDASYRYRLAGEETVDGYPSWKIEFEPAEAKESLYRGSVWIEKRTYARVRMAVHQRGTEAPFVSNDEVNHYRAVLGPDGTEHWVLSRIEGSQLYTVSGRSFVVNREVTFDPFEINPADFAALHDEAYRSEHPMLRDTDEGFRYLKRTEGGERVVEDRMPREQLFWLGGVFYNAAVDFPIPLAGVNYFNFDLNGSGAQMNVFFAGAVLLFNATDPDLFGSPLELGVDAYGQAFSFIDRGFVEGEEVPALDVDQREQLVRPFLAAPIGGFWKLRGSYELAWEQYGGTDDTAADFEVPQDTLVHTGALTLNWNRWAWSFAADASWSRRASWEAWGTPAEQAAFDPGTASYRTWGATLAKEVYLPFSQKLRFGVDWEAGDDLDRFSAFQFGFFSGRSLEGFSGSGIRYDRGGTAHVEYAFNILDQVRLAASVGYARVHDPEIGDGYSGHTGFGLSANFMGPWGTILNLEWGIALDSDLPGARGEQEIEFFFLKLF